MRKPEKTRRAFELGIILRDTLDMYNREAGDDKNNSEALCSYFHTAHRTDEGFQTETAYSEASPSNQQLKITEHRFLRRT